MLLTMQELWKKYSPSIEAEGFVIPIKSIKVYGVDPETGAVNKVRVTKLLRQKSNKIVTIVLDNNTQIKADPLHQFVLYNNLSNPQSADCLSVGDKLPLFVDGNIIPVSIVSINVSDNDLSDTFVYDVELEKYHLFINGNGIVTHNCCRLRNDSEKMKEFFNSLGSGGVKIGSHRVCTINLPRLAYQSSTKEDFINNVLDKMELCRDILKAHRELLQHEINQGLLPLYSHGFIDLKTQFSTIGIIGFYEAMDILGCNILDDDNLPFAKQVVQAMNDKNDSFAQEDRVLYNLEQIPGESAAVKLATKDHLLYDGDMNYKMYSNQFVPLVMDVPLAKRIKLQGVFDASMSGGSILHINIAEKIKSTEVLLTLMKYSVENNVIYFANNYNMAVCTQGHITVGKVDTCATCGSPIKENWLRVVGFMTPRSSWMEERRGKTDYESRVFY